MHGSVTGATHRAGSSGAFARFHDAVSPFADGGPGRLDLEPFWPSRQPHHFDQTCPGSPGASR